MSENSSVGQKHPYHLVDPSPLPFLSSIAGLAMAVGLVFYMHYDTKWLLILGTIGLLTVMFLWWRDVIKFMIPSVQLRQIIRNRIQRINIIEFKAQQLSQELKLNFLEKYFRKDISDLERILNRKMNW